MATPNMGLVLPAVGVTIGPTWAVQLNAALDVVDAHDHSPGNGVQLTPEAINIDSALPFNGNDAESVGRVELVSQPATTLLPASVYVVAGDLFYNNSAGQPVQLTIGNVPAAGGGAISGMTVGVSASYDLGTKSFNWNQSASLRAALDAGAVVLRMAGGVSSPAVSLAAPSSGVTSYTFTLPPVAPTVATQLLGGASPGSTLWLSLDGSTVELSGATLRVKPLGITAAQLATDAVTTSKIIANAVTGAKIGTGNVNGVQTANLADLAITTAKLAANAVTAAKLATGNTDGVQTANIADAAVTGAKIGTGNVNGVQTANIADLAITTAKLGAAQVTTAKIATGNVDGIQTANIADLAITTAKVAANAVTGAKIGTGNVNGVQTANIADLAITTAKVAANAVTGAKIGTGNVDGVQTANIADGAILTAKIGAAQVTTAKIATGNTDGIQTANIADLAISTAKLAANAVTGAKIGTGNTNGVQTANIADAAVTGAKIGTGNTNGVQTANLADSSVSTAKIADNAVTPEKLPLRLGYGNFTNITSSVSLSTAYYTPASTTTQQLNIVGGRRFTIAIQGNSGGTDSEFSIENNATFGAQRSFTLEVTLYSNGTPAVLRIWRTRFVMRGNVTYSLPPLVYTDSANNSHTNCVVILKIKADNTDVALSKLENIFWTIWQ